MAYDRKLVAYLACELVVAVISILGNAMVLVVFARDRRLRTPTNLYIASLAAADIATSGLATPLYVHSMFTQRPRDFHACLFVNTLILTFCTVSILHLVAVSYDRYAAVVLRGQRGRGQPTAAAAVPGKMKYAGVIIAACWLLGLLIGFLPLMGWHEGVPPPDVAPKCQFTKVIRMSYMIFLFYATILAPTALMVFFYGGISLAIRRNRDRLDSVQYFFDTATGGTTVTTAATATTSHQQQPNPSSTTTSTKRIVFSLALVVACFLLCWYPIHLMNVITYYCGSETCGEMQGWWYYPAIVLSHVSSAINPFIYAGTMPGYKQAFLEALACTKPHENEVQKRGSALPHTSNRRRQMMATGEEEDEEDESYHSDYADDDDDNGEQGEREAVRASVL